MTGLLGRLALRGAGLPAGPAASTPLRPPVGAGDEGGEPAEIVEEVVARDARPAPASPTREPPQVVRERVAPAPPASEVEAPAIAATPASEPAPARPPAAAIPAVPAREAPARVFRAPLERPAEPGVASRPPDASPGPVPQTAAAPVPAEPEPAPAPPPVEARPLPELPVQRGAAETHALPPLRRIVRRTVVERIEAPRTLPVSTASEPTLDVGRPEPTRAATLLEPSLEPLPEAEEPQSEPTDRAEAPAAPPAPEQTTAAPDVEVTIGTIEVQLAPEPPRDGQTPAERPEPQGFGAYAGIR